MDLCYRWKREAQSGGFPIYFASLLFMAVSFILSQLSLTFGILCPNGMFVTEMGHNVRCFALL